MDAEPVLEIRLLGEFAVRVGGHLVPPRIWRHRRAAAIVKLLALESGYRLHREQLLDTLWPELDPDSAANNLRGALHHARRGLEQVGAPPGVFLLRDGEQLLLGPEERLLIDVEVFGEAARRAWQSAEPPAAEHAARLYSGDLLPDDPYEDWAAARREGLRASYLALVTRLARLYEERGELSRAIAIHDRIVLTDPLEEAAHAKLMQLHAQMGNRSLALAQYARLQSLLDRELGTGPQPETQALAATIRTERLAPAVVSVTPPRAAPPPSTADIAPSGRLPVPVDALLGRDQELAELERLLGAARLVTLTGPGGIGKTRLAQEAARVCRAQFPDGVAFVDLAPLRDPAFVLPTIARALGIDETGNRPISDLLAASIGERRLLLVLDNFEHLTEAGPRVAALLESCPHLSVLSTSRIRLRLRGEREYPVQPLALPQGPERRSSTSLVELARVPAIALFAQRATAARPSFTLNDQDIDTIVAICRRLDGLPLAIELAAAHVRVLAPAQLLQRLARPLDVLGPADQDVPDRQRTLRGTIAWSHDLLTSQEQILFRRLSVFVGGWSLEGMEAVVRLGADTTEIAAVETLGRLIDHSLIETRSGPDSAELRYAMLETIREFAREQLRDSGEERTVRAAQAAWCLSLASQVESALSGPEEVHWLTRLDAERDNLHGALEWASEAGEPELALQLAIALWPVWTRQGQVTEGQRWLERTLANRGASDAARAEALYRLGSLAVDLSQYDRARAFYEDSLALCRASTDERGMARALTGLGIVAADTGKFAEARRQFQEALAIHERLGDQVRRAWSLFNLGQVASAQGDLDEARSTHQAALSLRRAMADGDTVGIGYSLWALGQAARRQGQSAEALEWLDQSLHTFQAVGDRQGTAYAVLEKGRAFLAQGALDDALPLLREATVAFSEMADWQAVIDGLEALAQASWSKGENALAGRLLTATSLWRDYMGLPIPPVDRPALEDLRRAVLGSEGHAAVHDRPSLESVVRAAIAEPAIAAQADVRPAKG